MKIRICGHDIEVTESDPLWSSGTLGMACASSDQIVLRPNLKKDRKASILIHEILHIIADLNQLKGLQDETSISVLAASLVAGIRDNRHLIKEFVDDVILNENVDLKKQIEIHEAMWAAAIKLSPKKVKFRPYSEPDAVKQTTKTKR